MVQKFARSWFSAAILGSALTATPALAQNAPVTVRVDAAADQHPISPLIYGVAFASDAALDDLNVPLHRHGGNATSRYNWQLNASNRAQDWYFQSIGESDPTPGGAGDDFIGRSLAAGAEPMLTIPMQDWVARLGPNREKLASFSIAKYGAQTDNDWQWFPDAGNGVRPDGSHIDTNDESDAHIPVDMSFQQGWVQHLLQTWGMAGAGGLNYYILDNEPGLWWETHRDVHRTGKTMDDLRDLILDYGQTIKAEDPNAQIVAPEVWGWSSYIFSGYDQQWGRQNGWSNLPDRTAHGGWDHLPWLLDQLRQADEASGERILDVFTVHFYPQGGEFSNDTSTQMQLRRNRSTRALWDPTYVDETWIGTEVRLIPRLHEWVDTYYPGTEIGLTEYNCGAEAHINGATTLADILGIMGREDLDQAAYWTTPDSATPTYKAIRMYRNYDGAKSTFGDVNALATAPDPDTLSAFAATRSEDGAMTVMLVAKALSGDTPVTVDLRNFVHAGAAEVWRLSVSNAISRLADAPIAGDSLTLAAPPQTVTLLVIPGDGGNQAPFADIAATPTSGLQPLDVVFDGSGSSDPDGAIVSYDWDFMDGATASGPTVNHTYAEAGFYGAQLTVTDDMGASDTATVTITVDSDAPVDDLAEADLFVSGTVAGDFTRTHADDALRQEVRERESGGKPANRHSLLEHRWRFFVAGGASVTFFVNAHGSASSDGDAFAFDWSTDNNSFLPMLTVTKTADDGLNQSYAMPPATRGAVYVRVRDTDRTPGNRSLDSVYVDHMYIRSEVVAGDPPVAPSNLAVASATTGRIDLAWLDNAADEFGYEVERSDDSGANWALIATPGPDAESHGDEGLAGDTAYSYRVRAFNGAGFSAYAGPVGATTPPTPEPEIALTATGFKQRGKQSVRLEWSGTTASMIDIRRDGALIATVPNNPPYTDDIGAKGSATYLYQVCEIGASTACSDLQQVVF